MEAIRIYTTSWCPDCWRTKQFLRERGISYEEVNVDEDPDAEDLILRVNEGRRKGCLYAQEVAGTLLRLQVRSIPDLLAFEELEEIPLNP